MSLQIKRDDNNVFVATDPDIPGLLVVSKNRNTLEDVLVPKALADLEIARLTARIAELEKATKNAVEIIERNLYHQREKVEDAVAILRTTLEASERGGEK